MFLKFKFAKFCCQCSTDDIVNKKGANVVKSLINTVHHCRVLSDRFLFATAINYWLVLINCFVFLLVIYWNPKLKSSLYFNQKGFIAYYGFSQKIQCTVLTTDLNVSHCRQPLYTAYTPTFSYKYMWHAWPFVLL